MSKRDIIWTIGLVILLITFLVLIFNTGNPNISFDISENNDISFSPFNIFGIVPAWIYVLILPSIIWWMYRMFFGAF